MFRFAAIFLLTLLLASIIVPVVSARSPIVWGFGDPDDERIGDPDDESADGISSCHSPAEPQSGGLTLWNWVYIWLFHGVF